MRKILLLVSISIIFGCARTTYYWYNSNPDANWNADWYTCENEATQYVANSYPVKNVFTAAFEANTYNKRMMSCLRAKGWYQSEDYYVAPKKVAPREEIGTVDEYLLPENFSIENNQTD